MILRHPGRVVFDRGQAGRGKDSDLAQPAADLLPPVAGAVDELPGRTDDAPHGRAESLGETDLNRVDLFRERFEGDIPCSGGVEDPRPVHVDREALPSGDADQAGEFLRGRRVSSAPVMGVFHAEQPCGRDVNVRRTAMRRDLRGVGKPRRVVRDEREDAAERGKSAPLEEQDVAFGAENRGVSPAAVRQQGNEVSHRSGRSEQGALMPRKPGHRLFQASDRGVLAVHVVADLGLIHGLSHPLGRTGDGVASQIDAVHVKNLLRYSETPRRAQGVRSSLTATPRDTLGRLSPW